MPFPCEPLLERLRRDAFGPEPGSGSDSGSGSGSGAGLRPDLVLPESRGRRGVEPLFAAYRVSCIPAIEAALAAGDRRMIGFHGRVRVAFVPLAEVEALCDPERAFLNVNEPAERERAEAMAERDEGER
ncbi:MAG: molybdenum cofactor guanylyltransferase, partial [Gemmatimonadota bacterium]